MKNILFCTAVMLFIHVSVKAQSAAVPVKTGESVVVAKQELPIKNGGAAASVMDKSVVPLRTSDAGGVGKKSDALVPLKSGDGGGVKKDSAQKVIVPLRSADPGGAAKAADPRPLIVTAAGAAKSGTQTGDANNNKTQLPSDLPVKKEQP